MWHTIQHSTYSCLVISWIIYWACVKFQYVYFNIIAFCMKSGTRREISWLRAHCCVFLSVVCLFSPCKLWHGIRKFDLKVGLAGLVLMSKERRKLTRTEILSFIWQTEVFTRTDFSVKCLLHAWIAYAFCLMVFQLAVFTSYAKLLLNT